MFFTKIYKNSIFAFFFLSLENVFLVPRSSVKRIGSVEVEAERESCNTGLNFGEGLSN